jgi:peptidyl-prolyl cis-trans isomerase C
MRWHRMSYDAPLFSRRIKGAAMKAFPLIAGLVLSGAIVLPGVSPAVSPALAQDAAKLPTVNGKAIPKSRLDFMVKTQTAQATQAGQGIPDGDKVREAVLDRLINIEVVVQEAERKGLGKNADVRSQIDLARQQIVFQAYLQDYLKSHPLKDEALRAEYNRVKGQRGDKEYKARHILVEKETDAKDLIEQLRKGAKFDELAKQSKDIGSKDRGGELDWQPAATYVKPFADALAKLEKGKTTESPVQTQFGFHVIRLDDVRNAQFPDFDSVKQQITQMLQNQEVERLVKDLRAKAKIE